MSTINSASVDDPLFTRLSKAVNKKEKEKKEGPTPEELNRIEEEQIRMMESFNDVLQLNSTRRTIIDSVKVIGGGNSRPTFIQAQLQPILDASGKDLKTVLDAVDSSYKALNSFGIYKFTKIGLDVAPPSLFSAFNSSSMNDLNLIAVVHLQQAKRFTARTGTDLGNGEGTGYANFVLRSLFGGAETLSFDASIGTRTRSSYLLNFTAPLNNSSIWKTELLAFMSSRKIPWASHEQLVKGISAKLKKHDLEMGYEAVLRTITSVEPTASDEIRVMAGPTIKTSAFWNYTKDTRDNHLLASKGYYFKLGQEIGGLLGLEKGDRPFMKGTFEGQVAKGFSIIKKDKSDLRRELAAVNTTVSDGVIDSTVSTDLGEGRVLDIEVTEPESSTAFDQPLLATESEIAKMVREQKLLNQISDDFIFHYSARGGLLWSYGDRKSHFMDRFFLGGPNDVRGFYLNGLGPKSGNDSLGGDVYFAQGASMITRIPGLSSTSALRFISFINGGSVLPLNYDNVRGTLLNTVIQPSVAAGFGLTYRHPVARFELNVTFPLIAKEFEGTRKGLQFGIGLSFL